MPHQQGLYLKRPSHLLRRSTSVVLHDTTVDVDSLCLRLHQLQLFLLALARDFIGLLDLHRGGEAHLPVG